MKTIKSTMTAEQYERLAALFDTLSEAPPGNREHDLRVLAGEDPELARLLERMLALDGQDDDRDLFKQSILDVRSVVDDEGSTPPTTSPVHIGPYRVIAQLGWGSVGDVYLAEQQTPVERQVAVKLLRVTAGASRSKRYAMEARALSSLSHPGIAQIYDAGMADDGRPYLVMEYVNGKPIDEACRAAGLDHRGILTLFTELCDAVQHAHQRGVIHRDLKPSNVLVFQSDGQPRVKVIDFGVAKLVDEAGAGLHSLTLQGQVLGTLDYMSPEQWRGEAADTRSDVYSLGVILYRLLLGRSPFGEQRGFTTQRDLRERPNDFMPELPRWMRLDIETILGKAIAHHPDQRYASPQHLAEDLGRALRGEPVLARRPTVAERAGRVVRTHPRASIMSAIACVLILTLAAYTVITRQQLAHDVEVQRTMIVGLLDDVLERLHRLTGAMETREALAYSLLARTEELLVTRPNDPELLEAKARLLMEIGDIKLNLYDSNLERHDDAGTESDYLESIRIFRALTASPHADIETWRRYARAKVQHGNLVLRRDRLAALEIYENVKRMHLNLAEQYPNHPGVLDDLCWSYDRIANWHWLRGHYDEHYQLAQRRMDLAWHLLSLDETRLLSHFNLMLAHFALARHYEQSKDPDQMFMHLQEATRLGDFVVLSEPNLVPYRIQLIRVLHKHALAALRAEQFGDARQLFERLDADATQLYLDNPSRFLIARWHVSAKIAYTDAAITFGEKDLARNLYLEAKQLADRYPEHVNRSRSEMMQRFEKLFAIEDSGHN